MSKRKGPIPLRGYYQRAKVFGYMVAVIAIGLILYSIVTFFIE